MALLLDPHGAELHPAMAVGMLPSIEALVSGLPADQAGVRIVDCPPLAHLLSGDFAVGSEVRRRLGSAAIPVRAILFDKSPVANWALDWHQDRTIAVCERREVAGFGRWNVKQGIVHVEPPFALMEQLLTVRIHIDPVSMDNGVLEVVSGSHRLGRIAERNIPAIVAAGPLHTCPAQAGDCWFYRTPILHRSARSRSSARRRVLQVDYCASDLPGGLAWRKV